MSREIEKQKTINLLKGKTCPDCIYYSSGDKCQGAEDLLLRATEKRQCPETFSCVRWISRNEFFTRNLGLSLTVQKGKILKISITPVGNNA